MSWRDLTCGEPRPEHEGRTATLAGWVARRRNSRGLDITPVGRKGLLEVFGLSI